MLENQQERRKDYLLLGQISADIKTVKEDVKIVKEKVDKHGEDLAGLKVKAGIWGGISGVVMVIPIYAKYFFSRYGN
jgi:hypothetical protein